MPRWVRVFAERRLSQTLPRPDRPHRWLRECSRRLCHAEDAIVLKAMRSHQPTFRELRRAAAPVMLGVFLLATQLAPLAHLATHRAGHTHGPQPATLDESSHEAAHRDGRTHAHAPTDRSARSRSHADQFVRRSSLPSHDGHADTDHDADDQARRSGGVPDHDHGRDSISHFGLALNEGPPPTLVPAPAGTIATPPDARPRAQRSTPRPQPPTRGPPDLTRRHHSLS